MACPFPDGRKVIRIVDDQAGQPVKKRPALLAGVESPLLLSNISYVDCPPRLFGAQIRQTGDNLSGRWIVDLEYGPAGGSVYPFPADTAGGPQERRIGEA